MAGAGGARTSCSVCVIGAGAAGLVAAQELRAEGHNVTVLEQGSTIGGVWAYDPATEADDPLGLRPVRKRVHSSMYASLRTNLPREIMGYLDLPFTPAAMNTVAASASASRTAAAAALPCVSIDARRYASHGEVLRYLHAYALHHRLLPLVKFGVRVADVEPADAALRRWRVVTADGGGAATYDAVVVAVGKYSEPLVPLEVPGVGQPGRLVQLHSHNYRGPQGFEGQTLLVVGAANSGDDISREVASVAARVLVSARSWPGAPPPTDPETEVPYGDRGNIQRRPMVTSLNPADCTAAFPAPFSPAEPIDAIIYCTGYKYAYPFLTGALAACGGGVSPDARHVEPLWLEMFPPRAAPRLSILGVPWKVVPFPQAQLQARLVARLLSGAAATLPPREVMEAEVTAALGRMREEGLPLRYAHMQNMAQFEYNARLAELCGPGTPRPPAWREAMYAAAGALKRGFPATYRDEPKQAGSEADIWGGREVLDMMRADLDSQLLEVVMQGRTVGVGA